MDFSDFWKTYPHPPHRGSKALAEQKFHALSLGQRSDMLAGLEKYRIYINSQDWYQPMMAQRWLNKSAKNWQVWIEAAEGEDADLSQIHRETEALRERNRRRQQAADEAWRDKYEKQFGYRPT